MSDLYHTILAFADKHKKLGDRGKPKTLLKVAKKCLPFAELGDESPELRTLAMMDMAGKLLKTAPTIKNSVLFSKRVDGSGRYEAKEVDWDGLKLPYPDCVFEFEIASGEDRRLSLIHKVFAVISETDFKLVVPKETPMVMRVFIEYFDSHDHEKKEWSFLPFTVPINPQTFRETFEKSTTKIDCVGCTTPSEHESALLHLAIKMSFIAMTEINQSSHTIQTAQPPKSLYGKKAPGHRKFYEHRVVVIDPERSSPREGDNSGLSGRKHALHAVRGFYRHLKKPKADGTNKIWIKPHWRGDKDLGVITKEYEIRKSA